MKYATARNTQDHCLSNLLPWSAPFEDPIILPDGRKLLTLKDAADYITKLPKKESESPLSEKPGHEGRADS